MTTKQKLLQVCMERADKRITDYKEEINLIKDAIESNDKAGSDEDDSGNEKLLSDLQKNNSYLINARNNREFLNQIKTNIHYDTAVLGSIVRTDSMHFYLATSIGKIDLENEIYYAISLNSPIGQLLKNKRAQDRFEFNQTKYIIKEII